MTAGSLAAPQIIPIRIPPPGKAKHEIDSRTPVEIKSGECTCNITSSLVPGIMRSMCCVNAYIPESADVSVMYTLDGSKPETVKRTGFADSTLKYTGPIRLPVGKVSVRAMAVTR